MTIIFDFFGVFCTPGATNWFKRNISTTEADLQALQALCTQSDYGRLSRAEFQEELSRLTGTPISDIVKGIAVETRINNPLIAYVRELKTEGRRIACLSNGTREWTLQTILDNGFEDLFEQIILSGDLGIVKPDPAIYAHALKVLDVEASKALFVDDRKANVDAAIACGMQGLVFTDTAAFIRDFERL